LKVRYWSDIARSVSLSPAATGKELKEKGTHGVCGITKRCDVPRAATGKELKVARTASTSTRGGMQQLGKN
jgi:hypothetical protein